MEADFGFAYMPNEQDEHAQAEQRYLDKLRESREELVTASYHDSYASNGAGASASGSSKLSDADRRAALAARWQTEKLQAERAQAAARAEQPQQQQQQQQPQHRHRLPPGVQMPNVQGMRKLSKKAITKLVREQTAAQGLSEQQAQQLRAALQGEAAAEKAVRKSEKGMLRAPKQLRKRSEAARAGPDAFVTAMLLTFPLHDLLELGSQQSQYQHQSSSSSSSGAAAAVVQKRPLTALPDSFRDASDYFYRFRPLILEEAGTVIAAAVAESSYAKKLSRNSSSSTSSGMRSLPAQLVYLEGGECSLAVLVSQCKTTESALAVLLMLLSTDTPLRVDRYKTACSY
eukprot:17805-Heterococcus_DN1.PRE.1